MVSAGGYLKTHLLYPAVIIYIVDVGAAALGRPFEARPLFSFKASPPYERPSLCHKLAKRFLGVLGTPRNHPEGI